MEALQLVPESESRSRAFREREDQWLAPGLQRFALMSGLTLHRGLGTRVYDEDGLSYIDWIGGIGVGGIGHSHPKWIAAIEAQVKKLSMGSFTTPARVELLERLGSHSPSPRLNRIQLYTSGAEAVESALRLAKCHTGKHEVVSFWGGFHGKTLGAMSLMGSDSRKGWGPLSAGVHVVPYANCYRCPLKLSPDSCGLACAKMGREQIKRQTSGAVAAVIVEPMQGTAGNVIPPREFMREARAMADELGALLIADEMITGFGRTGKYWGVEHSGVEPDIVTIGKQFGGGFPISGIITRDEIARAKPWAEPSGSSSSYGGNPLAAAAAAATLRIIDEEGLVENSRKMGELLMKRFQEMATRHACIGDVRGAGLFIGIELVLDRETKEKLPKSKTEKLFHECVKRGLLAMCYDSSFRIQPAMTIDEATIEEGVRIFEDALIACGL